VSRPSVIVIGAGVVGCTVAYELAKAGARVQVFETRAPGQGATRASAGILAPFIEGHGSAALRELGTRSLDLYDGFISRLREDLGVPAEGESPREIPYERTGTFELAMSDEEADRLRALSASLSGLGVESSWVEPSGFSTVETHASPEAKGGLLIPTHGYVGVTALTLAAMEAARKLYARFKSETGAIRISTLPNGRIGVKTTHATWEADRVVLAAGSWSSSITVEGADTVPVKPIRGQLLQLQSAPGILNRVLWGPGGYLVPWVDGSVLVGSTVEDVGFDESHTEEAVTRLRDMAVSLVPSLANAPVIDVRTGLRPKGPDDLPVLGPSRVIPGLIYATAHYRNGVLFVPLTAQLVADLVFNRGGDAALRHLQPSRVGKL
jgi:glycine oxidase